MTTKRMILLLAVALAGCGQRPDGQVSQATGGAQMEAAPLAAAAPQGGAPAPAGAPAAPAAPSVALPQIAYTYDYTLELPAKAVVPLFEKHRAACEAAGPARCQIIGAETETVAKTDTRATLTLRAETRWLAAFRAGLAGSAEAADGRLAASATASEDLGRQLSDSGAKLRALTTLRDRLQNLLATRNGKLSELLEIERELARVEGEIDATRSALADMSGRVSLPKATIVYRPDSLTVASADGSQPGLAGSLYEVGSTSLFLLLNFIAAVLPWLIVVVPLVWLVRTLLRRRREARARA